MPYNPYTNGHITRLSMDSSLYDEICVLCGASDGLGDNRLNKPCPITDPKMIDDRLRPVNEWRVHVGLEPYKPQQSGVGNE